MRDFPQNFVERVFKRGNRTVRRSRAGRVPLLQRVGKPDTLSAVFQMENGAFCIVEVMGMSKGYCSPRTGSTWSWTSSLRAFWKCHISLPRMIMV